MGEDVEIEETDISHDLHFISVLQCIWVSPQAQHVDFVDVQQQEDLDRWNSHQRLNLLLVDDCLSPFLYQTQHIDLQQVLVDVLQLQDLDRVLGLSLDQITKNEVTIKDIILITYAALFFSTSAIGPSESVKRTKI